MTTVRPGTRMTLAEYRELDETEDGVGELIDAELYQMPPATGEHQFLTDFWVRMINNLTTTVQPSLGLAFSNLGLAISELYAPTPDIIYLRSENAHLIKGSFEEGVPDLVIEILSRDRNRDRVMKRGLYADAGIPEYWVVDPASDTITVLELSGAEYVERAELGRGDTLTTSAIPGLSLSLEELFRDPTLALIRENR